MGCTLMRTGVGWGATPPQAGFKIVTIVGSLWILCEFTEWGQDGKLFYVLSLAL